MNARDGSRVTKTEIQEWKGWKRWCGNQNVGNRKTQTMKTNTAPGHKGMEGMDDSNFNKTMCPMGDNLMLRRCNARTWAVDFELITLSAAQTQIVLP